MKRFALVCLLATGAVAAHAETFFDSARVLGVEPQYESVEIPRNECRSEWVNETRHSGGGQHYGGAILGGVAGALLGNQVGGGPGRDPAPAVGAVVGALAGDRLANRDRGRYEVVPREVTSCRTVSDIEHRLTGYRVSYDYRGQYYTTLMREHPGASLQVRVSVDPVVR